MPNCVEGLSTNDAQLLKWVLPVANPPVRKKLPRSRAFNATSTPLKTSVCLPPKLSTKVTRLLLARPNFVGTMSYRPHTCCPPPFGRRGSDGAVTQYGVKSPGATSRLSVVVKCPWARRKYETSAEILGAISWLRVVDTSQLLR